MNINSSLYDNIHPYSNDLKWPFTTHAQSLFLRGRGDGGRRGRTRILNDSARKRNRTEVLANYNKTRINIGHQHGSWMELKEAMRVQTHTEVSLRVYLGKWDKHNLWRWEASIIYDAGRQAAYKRKQRTYTGFFFKCKESGLSYICLLGVSTLLVSTIFLLGFGNIFSVGNTYIPSVLFLAFHFILDDEV